LRRAPLLLLTAVSAAISLAALLRPLRTFVDDPPLRLSLPSGGGRLELERLGPLPPGSAGLGSRSHGTETVAGWRYRPINGAKAAAEPVTLWLKLATSSARSNRSYLLPATDGPQKEQDLQGCLALDGNGLDPSGMLKAVPPTPGEQVLWLLGLRPHNQQACWTLKL
jgi:hypothetical protein